MRLAVVSPFIDKQHGTEMCIAEQMERFVQQNGWNIELYSQQVSQLNDVRSPGDGSQDGSAAIHWHRISDIFGPHLLKFVWWFFANHWRRWRDRRANRIRPDLVYTPGTNCLDADLIMVQIVFHAFYEQARGELLLRRVPIQTWPRLIHRKIYYNLIMFLERLIYRNPRVRLVAVSNLIAGQLKTFLGCTNVDVIPNTVDINRFNPETRQARRQKLREAFQIQKHQFVVLIIGNDWKKKGLDTLLKAASQLTDIPLRIMVVGRDDQEFYRAMVQKLGLTGRITFENPSSDVVQFYAAADLYAGPSLEDGFNLPILEAMACGLPAIASSQTGASENITDRKNGLILADPQDDTTLAQFIRELYQDAIFRQNIAQAAADFVCQNCSWDTNASRTKELLETILERRSNNK
jgi:glycosyltransferase involved in cell wall biosynthesis